MHPLPLVDPMIMQVAECQNPDVAGRTRDLGNADLQFTLLSVRICRRDTNLTWAIALIWRTVRQLLPFRPHNVTDLGSDRPRNNKICAASHHGHHIENSTLGIDCDGRVRGPRHNLEQGTVHAARSRALRFHESVIGSFGRKLRDF